MSIAEGGGEPDRGAGHGDASKIEISGIAVHWYDESGVERLASSWPTDPRFELLVVDNGSEREPRISNAVVVAPGLNLGFAGAVNLGARAASGEIILILNSDVTLEPGALERLLDGFRRHPEAAGLAPRLLDERGVSQCRWQLRRLPSVWNLMLQSLLLPVDDGPAREPEAGSQIEQPAAAALAVRRQVLEEVGGFDEAFYPAWFEDVDLAARLRRDGHRLLYWPTSAFRHRLGSTLDRLGYRRFLWIYHANLGRYLDKHHGSGWAAVARCLLAPACLLRILLLPLRRPRRAADRRTAARGLTDLMLGAVSNWHLPEACAVATSPSGRARGQAR